MNEACGEWKSRLYGARGGSVAVVTWVGDASRVIFWAEVGLPRHVSW